MIKYCRYYNEENKTESVVAYSTLDGMAKEVEEKHTFNGNNVLKFADTIEELCDLYVCNGLVFGNLYSACKYQQWHKEQNIYGAIWTDKGLIYVAKMNEKGCLELL